MKILGCLLIGIGLIDLITSYTLENGSPIDPIVGETIAPFTAFVFLGLGYFFFNRGKDEGEEQDNQD